MTSELARGDSGCKVGGKAAAAGSSCETPTCLSPNAHLIAPKFASLRTLAWFDSDKGRGRYWAQPEISIIPSHAMDLVNRDEKE